MRIRIGAIAWALMLIAFPDASAQGKPSRGYKCPALGALNCMPTRRGRRPGCNESYKSWAFRHCPGFRIVR
jgi:hypothetical protein